MDTFVEVGAGLLKNIEKKENIERLLGNGKIPVYLDLSQEDFLSAGSKENKDAEAMQATQARIVENFGQQMRQAELSTSLATQNQNAVKKTISALKFVLPKLVSAGALFIPGLLGAALPSWDVSTILNGIEKIREEIDNLVISDYKSTMMLFKDVLIDLANDVVPDLDDVKTVYRKAIDGHTKLDYSKIQEKVELTKIQMFCIIFINSYDQENRAVMPFDMVPENRKKSIRDKFVERLKDLQMLSEANNLETSKDKYQNIVDAIDYIKATSFPNVRINDTIYQVNDVAVKVFSVKGFMITLGENDSLNSSLSVISQKLKPGAEEITMQGSAYKETKNKNWFLKVHLPSEEDYKDLVVFCSYMIRGQKPVIFLPLKVDIRTWCMDTKFCSDMENMITFYMCKPGYCSDSSLVEENQNNTILEHIKMFSQNQFEAMLVNHNTGRGLLETKPYSVMTVIELMNLTESDIPVSSPTFSSGWPCDENPWPTKLLPLKVSNLVGRKAAYSVKGSVGATVLTLSPSLNMVLYWSTPYDQNLAENCFGVGHFPTDDSIDPEKVQEKVSSSPEQPPEGTSMEVHKAKDGPVRIELPDNWIVQAKMTTDHVSALDIILYTV